MRKLEITRHKCRLKPVSGGSSPVTTWLFILDHFLFRLRIYQRQRLSPPSCQRLQKSGELRDFSVHHDGHPILSPAAALPHGHGPPALGGEHCHHHPHFTEDKTQARESKSCVPRGRTLIKKKNYATSIHLLIACSLVCGTSAWPRSRR